MRYFHRIRVVVSGLTYREIERTALETPEKREIAVLFVPVLHLDMVDNSPRSL